MDGKFVITIARQHYTGGLKIGKLLAEELGVHCYDSELFTLVSSDDDKEIRAAHDQRLKGTGLYDVSAESNILDYQSQIIRDIADRESCIIVGRCSNFILRDRPDTISVFIHAPEKFRIKRASSVHYMSDAELAAYLKKADDKKAEYYEYHTGYKWYDVTQYDLSVDCEKFGIRGCVDYIKKYTEMRFS